MLKPLVLYAVVASSTIAGLNSAVSAEFGTAEEAKAMLIRAIDELKTDKLIAIAEFGRIVNRRVAILHPCWAFQGA